MNKDELHQKRVEALSNLWYIVRVLTGMLLHIFMFLCVIAYVEHVYVVLEMIPHKTDPISHVYSTQVHLLVAIAAFASGMAGIHWVKTMYIRHIIPEVLDDITKKIIDGP